MSDIKEVKISMSEADMKAFSRSTTRRRRATGGASAGVDKSAAEIASLPAPAAPASVIIPVTVTPSTPPMPAPATVSASVPVPPTVSTPAPVPSLATTTVVGGASVKIQPKKNVGNPENVTATPTVVPTASAAKILPNKKRIMTAPPAQTIRKPRIVVPLAATEEINTPKITTSSKTEGGEKQHTRKFKERKISIEVKSAKATRKHRKTIKHRIRQMPIASVKKFLLRKGVLKPKAEGSKDVPDDIMRSMLKDYLLLHSAD